MTREFPDELLSALLDDELPPAERAQVEQHLAGSEADRQLLAELKSLRAEVAALPQAKVSPDFSERVVRAAVAEAERHNGSRGVVSQAPPPVGRFSKRSLAGAAFASAAALAASFFLLVAQPWRPAGQPDGALPLAAIPTAGVEQAVALKDQLVRALAGTAPGESEAVVLRLRVSKGVSLADALDAALGKAGIATWNVEYRAVGDVGGGWPGTGDDVARAVEFVAELVEQHPLDRNRVVLVGHSAGGHLALWAAKRAQLPVVSLAGVSDMRESAERIGREGAAARFMGGLPEEVPEHYAEGSPRDQLPLGVRQILVHGTEDTEVPYAMSLSHAEAAGDEAELVTLEGAGHFELIDPQAREWERVLEVTRRALSS
jgi:anti-sigma factor RsiW